MRPQHVSAVRPCLGPQSRFCVSPHSTPICWSPVASQSFEPSGTTVAASYTIRPACPAETPTGGQQHTSTHIRCSGAEASKCRVASLTGIARVQRKFRQVIILPVLCRFISQSAVQIFAHHACRCQAARATYTCIRVRSSWHYLRLRNGGHQIAQQGVHEDMIQHAIHGDITAYDMDATWQFQIVPGIYLS